MKLLVLAQTPPPVHGQSLMVRTLVDGLPSRGIQVFHVNLSLSRDSADIGRWRIGKIFSTLGAAARTIVARFRHDCDTLYYVPAPGKRGALYRDWLLMILCRPFFPRLVLHWHAVGLGEWLDAHATTLEQMLTRSLLGHASLALVLAPELARDAQLLAPRRIAILPNCAPDPGPPPPRARRAGESSDVLFLGQCSRTKGLFATIEALALAHVTEPGALRLTVAGGFASENEEHEFRTRLLTLPPELVRYEGVVNAERKNALFRRADIFCFPTQYPHEGQPLTLIEALAHDVPIVTSRWRAIPGMLPRDGVHYVDPDDPPALARTLLVLRHVVRPEGALRQHYLAHYSPARHLDELARALTTTG